MVDPRDNKPFYVGVTILKINMRLGGHISELKTYPECNYTTKMSFIHGIMKEGKKPRIRLLKVVPLPEVDYYEHFFYSMFIHQGFILIQKPTAFSYSKKTITDRNKILNNQQVKQYMQLWYKNILVLIW